MKSKKGITLIALIITIIVMLILVAVTINVALNGGIFEKATSAKQKTEREVAREQLVAAMVGAYDNKGYFVKPTALPEGMKWGTKEETYETATNDAETCDYVITSTNEIFYIDPNDGTILDEKSIDNLIPTEEELAEAGTDYVFASSGENNAIQYLKNQKVLVLGISDRYFFWMCTEEAATSMSNQVGHTVEANKWYEETQSGLIIPSNYPTITAETFITVYSQSYLKRVISSF